MNQRKITQHLRRTFSAFALAAALCALPKVRADQPVAVSGTWNLCGHNMWDTYHQCGRTFTINVYQNQIFSGPIVGTLFITPDDPEFDVGHLAKDGVTVIRVNFHGSGAFAGSVLGRTASASAIMSYEGKIAADGTGHATWTLDDPVAGIHGNGTFDGNPPDTNPCEGDGYYVTGTYSGKIQLTP